MNDLIRDIIRVELEDRLEGRHLASEVREEMKQVFLDFANALMPPQFKVVVRKGKDPNSIIADIVIRK